MPSLTDELTRTRTAQWHRLARSQQCSAAWKTRELCFAALVSVLEGSGSRHDVIPPSLSVIARMVSAAPATLYNWWGADQGAQTVSRWAGPDPAIKPSVAFVAEAKVVSFWPYRSGCLSVADAFDMNLTELACAYFRTLGAWASDCPALASCRPSGPPGSVAEDLAVIARLAPDFGTSSRASICGQLTHLAGKIVANILQDASLTPAGATDGVREDMTRLLAPRPDRLTDRVEAALAELADRMLHGEADEEVLTQAQFQQIRRAIARIEVTLGRDT